MIVEFTHEFIQVQRVVIDRAMPTPYDALGNLIFSPHNGMVCQMSEPYPENGLVHHRDVGIDSGDWEAAMGTSHYLVSAANNYPAALAEIERLRAKNDELFSACSKALAELMYWFMNTQTGEGPSETLMAALEKAITKTTTPPQPVAAMDALADAYHRARAADPRVITRIRISPETEQRLNHDERLRIANLLELGYGDKMPAVRIERLFGVPVEVVPGLVETEFVR
jgi:hypothetical protein